jgi:hypothetical protein
VAIGKATFDLSFLGDAELVAKLNLLQGATERQLLASSMKRVGKMYLKEAKARVRRQSSALYRSLVVSKAERKRNGIVVKVHTGNMAALAALGARRTKRVGLRGARREGFYPMALEVGYVRGTRTRREWVATGTDKKGRPYSRKRVSYDVAGGVRVAPRSFMRSAMNANRSALIGAMRKDLAEGITKFWNRRAAQADKMARMPAKPVLA